MSQAKAVLQIRGLKTNFYTDLGVVKAVRGVDLDVFPGKTLCVVGESGSGKSIMAYSALRLIDPPGRIDAGSILYNGRELIGLREDGEQMRRIRGAEIAMISQEPMTALSPVHTVGNQIREAILLHNRISRREAKERAAERARRDRALADALLSGVAMPAMLSAVGYYDSRRRADSPANLIQAQRDFFGAHTFERKDRPRGEFFHHEWNQPGVES